MFDKQIGKLEKNVRFELLANTFSVLAKKIPKGLITCKKRKLTSEMKMKYSLMTDLG